MARTGKEKSRSAVAKRDFFWDGMVEMKKLKLMERLKR